MDSGQVHLLCARFGTDMISFDSQKNYTFQQNWEEVPLNIPISQMRKIVSDKWWNLALSEYKTSPPPDPDHAGSKMFSGIGYRRSAFNILGKN